MNIESNLEPKASQSADNISTAEQSGTCRFQIAEALKKDIKNEIIPSRKSLRKKREPAIFIL